MKALNENNSKSSSLLRWKLQLTEMYIFSKAGACLNNCCAWRILEMKQHVCFPRNFFLLPELLPFFKKRWRSVEIRLEDGRKRIVVGKLRDYCQNQENKLSGRKTSFWKQLLHKAGTRSDAKWLVNLNCFRCLFIIKNC